MKSFMKFWSFFFIFLSVLLISSKSISADNYPSYENGVLSIPRVDTSDHAGNFQNVKLKLTTHGTWELQSYKTVNQHPLYLAPVNHVELIVVDSSPQQVFLKIFIQFSNGCGEIGQINQRLNGNRFDIDIHADHPDLPIGSYGCTSAIRDLEKIIALPIYDLSAGDYEYRVNDSFSGTFQLQKDNKL